MRPQITGSNPTACAFIRMHFLQLVLNRGLFSTGRPVSAAAAGTKGPGCPVLVSPFLAMIPGIQGCFSHHVVKVGGINSPNKHVLDMLPDEGEVLSLCNTLNPRSSSFYAFCSSNQEIENPTQSRDIYNAGHA